jgi:transcriptional regulator of acetoin/glycerol metabolism
MDRLLAHPWPGNVRELINALEYAFVLCRGARIEPEHLPADVIRPSFTGGRLNGFSRPAGKRPGPDRILEALERAGGKKVEAARLLGISRVTLWKRMKEYGLEGR